MSDAPEFRLKHAPIIEAIVDIHCDLPPGLDRAAFEAAARTAFGKAYSGGIQAVQVQEYDVEMKPDTPPKPGIIRQRIQAFRFLSADKRQIVQPRFDGFSFNRLAPYSSLDDYLPEIRRCWDLFLEFAKPVVIRRVGLRYINRIVVPFVNGQLHLADYLRCAPHVPMSDGYSVALTGFMHQHQMVHAETGNLINVILAAQPIETAGLPVILDLDAFKLTGLPPHAWDEVLGLLCSLRRLKNHVFRETLTPKCLTLF
ncbi:hypothetical protein OPIT5_13205 [Opitutaceae bacterium TAV5]|nr:hypothetical protein OPIT5_13205 [Opitutaceae bacterium TAV5]